MDIMRLTAFSVVALIFAAVGIFAMVEYWECKRRKRRVEFSLYLRIMWAFMLVSCIFGIAGDSGGYKSMLFVMNSVVGSVLIMWAIGLWACRKPRTFDHLSVEYKQGDDWVAVTDEGVGESGWMASPLSENTIMRSPSSSGTVFAVYEELGSPELFTLVTRSGWRTCRIVQENGEAL